MPTSKQGTRMQGMYCYDYVNVFFQQMVMKFLQTLEAVAVPHPTIVLAAVLKVASVTTTYKHIQQLYWLLSLK